MSLQTLAQFTIGAGARELKEDIHDINTPTSRLFDMPMNQHVEPGDQVELQILYKDEASQIISTGDDTIDDGTRDPFIEASLPWSYRVTSYTEDDILIEKNLGGYNLAQLADGGSNVMSRVPSGSKNTLIGMLAPRFRNMNRTQRKRIAEDFFTQNVDEQGNIGPVGIDQITTPNVPYAGLSHDALGVLPFTSDLLTSAGGSGSAYMWNPLVATLSGTIDWEHFVDASTDLNKGAQFAMEMPQSGRAWNCFLMSTRFYNNSPFMKDFLDQRRRTSADDAELGPMEPLVDSRLGMKLFCDPNQRDDSTVYFWKEGMLKKYMQKKQSMADTMQVNRAWNQQRIIFFSRIGYQYGTNARWMCGKITTTGNPF